MFSEHSFLAGSVLNVLANMTFFKLIDNLESRYPHFPNKSTEAQRG